MQRKKKRTLRAIGQRRYNFDFTLEKNIYSCLCCSYGAKKAFKKLDDEYKFNSYQEWEQYVHKKYKNYCKSDLIEFSRYLNQNIRNINPIHDIYNLMFSVMITAVLTYILSVFLKVEYKHENVLSSLFIGIFYFLLIIFVVILLIIFIWQFIIPIFDNNIVENFLEDYKEIIDRMIENPQSFDESQGVKFHKDMCLIVIKHEE